MSSIFEVRSNEYRAFLVEHARDPQGGSTEAEERSLSRWLTEQRTLSRRGKIAADRSRAFDEINPDWLVARWRKQAVSSQQTFGNRVEEYRTFLVEHDRDPQGSSTDVTARSLSRWLTEQRTLSRRGELAADRSRALDKAVPDWRIGLWRQQTFGNRVEEYRTFLGKHDRDPQGGSTDVTERSLSRWLTGQRTLSRRGELAADRSRALDKAVPDWNIGLWWKQNFDNRVEEYRTFLGEHGRNPHASVTDAAERSLNGWISDQRTAGRRGVLPAEHQTVLDDIHPEWDDTVAFRHLARVDEYAAFFLQHGHDPSSASTDLGEELLARWLIRQRASALADELSADNRALLDAVNPDWRGNRARYRRQHFSDRVDDYADFISKEGYDPTKGSSASTPYEAALGRWLSHQRLCGRRGDLPAGHSAALDAVNPGWRQSDRSRRRKG